MAKYTNYLGVIKATGLTESSNTHTPEVQMRINLVRNLDTNDPCNRQVIADLWLSEKCKDKTIALLCSLGFDSENLADINGDILKDCECEVSTTFEEYNGKVYEKVAFVNKVGTYASRGIKRMDDAQSNDFARRFSQALRKNKKNVGEKLVHVETEEEKAAKSAPAKLAALGAETVEAPTEDDMNKLPF